MKKFSINATCPVKTGLFLLILSLTFFGCQTKNNHEGKTVFRYNEAGGITSLDPAFARTTENTWAVNQLFNGLVQLDEKLQIKPCIAQRWEITDSAKTYTFFLRNNVFFHDHNLFPNAKGRKVVAQDFVYSFKRILDKKTASTGTWVFTCVDSIEPFKAINDSTFQIHLQKPFRPFLSMLSNVYCSVIPHEIAENYGSDFRRNPVGTGPFQFKRWEEGEKLILTKNPHYFETENGIRLPYLDAVAISFIKDRQTAYLEFIKGNFDYMSGLDGSYKDDLLNADGTIQNKHQQTICMSNLPFLKTDYLGILVDDKIEIAGKSILINKKIRQAINYAIDRKKIIQYLRNNIGTPALNGFVPKGMPAFDSTLTGYSYNPQKAIELLKECGFNQTKKTPEIKLITTAVYVDVCEFIQKQLATIGIELKIDVVLPAINTDAISQSKVNFFRKSWVADYADAENYLSVFLAENFSPKGPNYTHFSNATYDELYRKAVAELDDEKRFAMYHQMEKIIIDEAPVIPIYYDAAAVFYHKNMHGIKFNSMNMLTIKYAMKE